jgi:glycosyltransferase involved in cell wall biosynthesis
MTLAPAKTTVPLRIVGVISFMNAAGAQEALLRIARHLRQRGHEMSVWFLYEEIPAFRGEPHTYTFAAKPKLSAFEYVKVFLALRHRIRREKPDVVIGFLPLGQVFGAVAAASSGVKARIASQRVPGPTYGRVMRWLDWICGTTGLYGRIVCVSEAVRASFSSYPSSYRRKLCVVHNGIDWPQTLPVREIARRTLGLADGTVAFLAVGRLTKQKNYPFMLERVAETPGIVLLIAGDGALRDSLERAARDLGLGNRVRFLGAVTRHAVRELLAASDVFIQTSAYEGQSNAVLEAMHAGLPIIVGDIPTQRETLCDETGAPVAILAPFADPQSWSDGMAQLRDQPALRARMGATAKALVERRFALAEMIDGFERVIREEVGRIDDAASSATTARRAW